MQEHQLIEILLNHASKYKHRSIERRKYREKTQNNADWSIESLDERKNKKVNEKD